VTMLPPRVMPAPARVKGLLLPVAPVLLKLMPAKSGFVATRLLVVMFWTLPTKVSAAPVDGEVSKFQLAGVFQKPEPPVPSQVLPAVAECEERSATMAEVSGKERRAVERRVRDKRVFISKIVRQRGNEANISLLITVAIYH